MENKTDNGEIQIDLWRMLHVLRTRIWFILAIGLLFACGAAAYTKFYVTPTYTSTATMLVISKETTLTSIADLQLGSQLTDDYAVLTVSRSVLEEVIDNLGLDMSYTSLRNCVTVTNLTDTHILSISAVMSDPRTAKAVVDELASVSSEYIAEKMEVTAPKIIEEGEISFSKTGPNMRRNILIGFLIGAVLVILIVLGLELLNDSLQNEEDIQRYLGLPTLAIVPDKGQEAEAKRRGRYGRYGSYGRYGYGYGPYEKSEEHKKSEKDEKNGKNEQAKGKRKERGKAK